VEKRGEVACLQLQKAERRKQAQSDEEVFKNDHYGGSGVVSGSEKQVKSRKELSNRLCFQISCAGNQANITRQ